MARIEIKDLPKDMKISRDNMRKVIGGGVTLTSISDEMDMSYNLQYLQLQQDMQAENRQFTMMSNIMKTKHDTAKAAINNIR